MKSTSPAKSNNTTKNSIGTNKFSRKAGGGLTASGIHPAYNKGGSPPSMKEYIPFSRDICVPTIPSNLEGDQTKKAQFNSIGYYGDLLSRLDDQIKTVEDVYKHSFYSVQ